MFSYVCHLLHNLPCPGMVSAVTVGVLCAAANLYFIPGKLIASVGRRARWSMSMCMVWQCISSISQTLCLFHRNATIIYVHLHCGGLVNAVFNFVLTA